jgi:hypothetical protein
MIQIRLQMTLHLFSLVHNSHFLDATFNSCFQLSETVPKNHSTFEPIPIIENRVQDNTQCQVSGWGSITYVSHRTKYVMKFLQIAISPIAEETRTLRNAFDGQY